MNPADVSSEKKVMLKNDVVSISDKGVVTAIGAGCTHVKVKKDNVEKILTISVNQPSVSVVHMNTGSSGKKISIYGLKKAIAWKPDDATVVSVDSKGKIKPLKAGHTTLRYTEGTFNYVVEMYVEEIKFTGVQLYGENAILSGSGSKYSLTMKPDSAIMLKADGIFQNVLFTSGKDSVVFADEAGVITARSSGKTKLTATVNGKKITINVEVKKQ